MFHLFTKLRSKHEATSVDPPATHCKEENDYYLRCIICNIQGVDTKDDEWIEDETENCRENNGILHPRAMVPKMIATAFR